MNLLIAAGVIIVLMIIFHFTPWSKANRLRRLLDQIEAGDGVALKSMLGPFGRNDLNPEWGYYLWNYDLGPKRPWRKQLVKRTEAIGKKVKAYHDAVNRELNRRQKEKTERQREEDRLTFQAQVAEQITRVREHLTEPITAESAEPRIKSMIGLLRKWIGLDYKSKETLRGHPILFSQDAMVQQLNDEFSRLRIELTDRAEAGDAAAFQQLSALLQTYATRDSGPDSLSRVGADDRQWPSNWNDLVARFIDNPMLKNFNRLPDFVAGDVALSAAEAIRTGQLTNAKIIMAFCLEQAPKRIELGDVLWAELVKFIEVENAKPVQTRGQVA